MDEWHEGIAPAHSGDIEENEQDAESKGLDEEKGELDLLDIALQFELGKARISLGELRSLTKGSVVFFEGGSPASIAIMASQHCLGRGEVVAVDDRLGIRITHWGTEK